MNQGKGQIHLLGTELRHLTFTYPLRLFSPSPHRECKSRTVFLLSHGGGFVSGDAVDLEIVVEAEGVLSLLTQGSTKIFKKLTPTSKTRSTISAHVHPHSLLIILPEPVVPFAQSHFESLQTILLESNASLVFLDWMVGGRVKMGGSARQDAWLFDLYESRVDLLTPCTCTGDLEYKEFLRDAWVLNGEEAGKDSFGYTCMGSLVLLGPRVEGLVRRGIEMFDEISIGGRNNKSHTSNELRWSLSRLKRKDICVCRATDGLDVAVGVVIRFCAVETYQAQQLLSKLLQGLGEIAGSDIPSAFR